MARSEILMIRMNETEKAALKCVAQADQRAMATLARKIIVEWLCKQGAMKEPRR